MTILCTISHFFWGKVQRRWKTIQLETFICGVTKHGRIRCQAARALAGHLSCKWKTKPFYLRLPGYHENESFPETNCKDVFSCHLCGVIQVFSGVPDSVNILIWIPPQRPQSTLGEKAVSYQGYPLSSSERGWISPRVPVNKHSSTPFLNWGHVFWRVMDLAASESVDFLCELQLVWPHKKPPVEDRNAALDMKVCLLLFIKITGQLNHKDLFSGNSVKLYL